MTVFDVLAFIANLGVVFWAYLHFIAIKKSKSGVVFDNGRWSVGLALSFSIIILFCLIKPPSKSGDYFNIFQTIYFLAFCYWLIINFRNIVEVLKAKKKLE